MVLLSKICRASKRVRMNERRVRGERLIDGELGWSEPVWVYIYIYIYIYVCVCVCVCMCVCVCVCVCVKCNCILINICV